MRPDIAKVIVERPRPGSSRHVARRFRRIDPKAIALTDDDVEVLPSRIGHKRAAALAGDRKSLNENLSPLRRFLAKQVGRPWDKVWAEISAHMRPDNTVQQHVRDHVQDFVAYRTFAKNGRIFIGGRFGGPQPLSDRSWPELFVDPRTGLLCRNKARQSSRIRQRRLKADAARKLNGRLRSISHDRQLHLLDDGNWWEVTLAPIPHIARPVADVPVADVIDRARLSDLAPAERYQRYGVYAISKRPLSRKELKSLRLRECGRAHACG
jgi:hypothetical protein